VSKAGSSSRSDRIVLVHQLNSNRIGITTLATAVGAATNPAEAGDKDRRRRYRKQGRRRHRRYWGGKWEWYWGTLLVLGRPLLWRPLWKPTVSPISKPPIRRPTIPGPTIPRPTISRPAVLSPQYKVEISSFRGSAPLLYRVQQTRSQPPSKSSPSTGSRMSSAIARDVA
jgi:hypothetical protein